MGFEPTTFCMASRRSSQLSYSRVAVEYSRGACPDPAPPVLSPGASRDAGRTLSGSFPAP
jgi:hypothetical protein